MAEQPAKASGEKAVISGCACWQKCWQLIDSKTYHYE
ncbi:hypothetical protein BDEG_27533 [Batrachochytrium dendrobatidis JEL423]|uniref:Uncharacterized protein n=1 Tax=Batrachochytrium dendrobatidis (strain JEL423) TaxID=403673 RepID=A0A177WW38_BATDL|nr:hypothetical protein BDEG_27533 [Batrachochytrium dendrobatidis JEL423]